MTADLPRFGMLLLIGALVTLAVGLRWFKWT